MQSSYICTYHPGIFFSWVVADLICHGFQTYIPGTFGRLCWWPRRVIGNAMVSCWWSLRFSGRGPREVLLQNPWVYLGSVWKLLWFSTWSSGPPFRFWGLWAILRKYAHCFPEVLAESALFLERRFLFAPARHMSNKHWAHGQATFSVLCGQNWLGFLLDGAQKRDRSGARQFLFFGVWTRLNCLTTSADVDFCD